MQFGQAAAPAWPMLSQGFFGTIVGNTPVRRLGFAAAPGAAVLDAQGRLVGIALAPADGPATWLPLASAMPSPPAATAPPPHAGLALTAPDEIYEAGLRRALQVLVDAPG
jgi:hypothetical protein